MQELGSSKFPQKKKKVLAKSPRKKGPEWVHAKICNMQGLQCIEGQCFIQRRDPKHYLCKRKVFAQVNSEGDPVISSLVPKPTQHIVSQPPVHDNNVFTIMTDASSRYFTSLQFRNMALEDSLALLSRWGERGRGG